MDSMEKQSDLTIEEKLKVIAKANVVGVLMAVLTEKLELPHQHNFGDFAGAFQDTMAKAAAYQSELRNMLSAEPMPDVSGYKEVN